MSYKKSKDNDCKNNLCSLIPQEEPNNNGNDENKSDKPLANLLIADDDPVLVQVLKLGLPRNKEGEGK